MTERPILFSGSMVRAILAGTKTQTRRMARNVETVDLTDPANITDELLARIQKDAQYQALFDAPSLEQSSTVSFAKMRYEVGDRLWVRESWQSHTGTFGESIVYAYRATDDDRLGPWRPSIHMPREACRILLEITEVRMQRLQRISEVDARAEGAPPNHPSIDVVSREYGYPDFSRSWFAQLWDSINAKRAPWVSDPWVWALTFRRVLS